MILNVSDESFGANQKLLDKISEKYPSVEIAGKFEMELNQLDEHAANMFMNEYNIKESALDKLTRLSYTTLGLISFFTHGKDEVRAWSLKKGKTALDAAAAVHTDLANKFIRTERYKFEDFKKYGSEKELKHVGRFYLDGKDYIVKDGDIIKIRHN